MIQTNFIQLLFLYLFLLFYAVERAVFAFKVPARIKPTRKPWLTFIPFLTYIALFFISIIEYSKSSKSLNFILSLLGIFIFALGICFRYGAVRAFRINKQNWISHIDSEHISMLIQNGPYKFIRHPYYLSVILELCGIALLLNAFRAIILIFLIQAPLLWRRIITEEAELTRKFANQYLLYKKQVATIFPFPLRSKGK